LAWYQYVKTLPTECAVTFYEIRRAEAPSLKAHTDKYSKKFINRNAKEISFQELQKHTGYHTQRLQRQETKSHREQEAKLSLE